MATSSPATTSAPSTPDAGGSQRSDSLAPSAKRIKTEHSAAPSPLSTNTVRHNDFATNRIQTPSLPPVPSSAVNSTSHYRTATPSQQSQQASQPQQDQRENLESLVDVMGSSGIDLRAEEEAIQRRGVQARSNAQPRTVGQSSSAAYDDELYLQVYPLAYKVHTIAQKHGLSVDAAVLNYLSLAARMRIKNLLETMVASSRHRSWSSHQHPPPRFPNSHTPMYHETISSNPARQLAAVEKAERGDEARRRKQRLARDAEASALASGSYTDADLDGMMDDGTGTPRLSNSGATGNKKPKKIGPGVAARNMSEDVRKRLADSTAMRNLGGGSSKYSWLSGSNTANGGFSSSIGNGGSGGAAGDGGGGSRLPKPKFAPQPPVNSTDGWGHNGNAAADGSSFPNTSSSQTNANNTGAWGDVAARQAAKLEEERQARLRVTLRDALFALEYERRGGAGHGSGESLLYRLRARANPNTQ